MGQFSPEIQHSYAAGVRFEGTTILLVKTASQGALVPHAKSSVDFGKEILGRLGKASWYKG